MQEATKGGSDEWKEGELIRDRKAESGKQLGIYDPPGPCPDPTEAGAQVCLPQAGSLLSWTDPKPRQTQALPGRTSKGTDLEPLTLSGQVSGGGMIFVSVITFDLESSLRRKVYCTYIFCSFHCSLCLPDALRFLLLLFPFCLKSFLSPFFRSVG